MKRLLVGRSAILSAALVASALARAASEPAEDGLPKGKRLPKSLEPKEPRDPFEGMSRRRAIERQVAKKVRRG